MYFKKNQRIILIHFVDAFNTLRLFCKWNKCIFLKCGFLYRECGLVFFTMWWTNTSGICLTVRGESVHVRMIHCRIQFATKFGWRKEALPMMHSGKSFLTKDSWTMFIIILTSGKLHIFFFSTLEFDMVEEIICGFYC